MGVLVISLSRAAGIAGLRLCGGGIPQAVILDRDGVINHDSPEFIKSPAEWHPISCSIAALAMLSRAGFLLGVATNQSGVARGLFDRASVEAIHARMRETLLACGTKLASIRYCPHGPGDGCACRKPAPGLLLEVAADLDVPVGACVYIGDSLRDVQAALAAGVEPWLVRTGNGMRDEAAARALGVTRVFDDLYAAAIELCALAEATSE